MQAGASSVKGKGNRKSSNSNKQTSKNNKVVSPRTNTSTRDQTAETSATVMGRGNRTTITGAGVRPPVEGGPQNRAPDYLDAYGHLWEDEDIVLEDLANGNIDVDHESNAATEADSDTEVEELARLRCTSVRTEVLSDRAKRRTNRCADYPGLAFGSSGIFSSNTMMKFSVISNELHNIMNVQLRRAEGEVAALNRRIQLLEEDLERAEERLKTATQKLEEASGAADESERIRKALENRSNMEDDRVGMLEAQLGQAKLIAEEADKKYEEVARKLVMLETDLERSEERAEHGEVKIVELEEELRVVGNNLKSLEVSEEKATHREEGYEDQIRTISHRMKEAEVRAEFAERSVQKLLKEVDRLEEDLIGEREKSKMLSEEMETTLQDIQAL